MSLFALSGCASVGRFSANNEEFVMNSGVYPATKMDTSILDSATKDHWGSGMAGILSPFAVIDIPFSLITDTVMLPYDWYRWSYNSKYIQFWNNVALNNDVSLSMNEYLGNYKEAGAYKVLRQSKTINNKKLLWLYFDIASTDNNQKQSKLIIERIIDKAHKYPKLSAHVCSIAANNMSQDKYQYGLHLMMKNGNYPATCVNRLAEAGLPCVTLLWSKNLAEKYFKKCYFEDKKKYRYIFVSNSSTPPIIHDEIYKDIQREKKELLKKYDSINQVPGGFGGRVWTNDLARNTRSMSLINKLIALNSSGINKNLNRNKAVPKEYKDKIKANTKH